MSKLLGLLGGMGSSASEIFYKMTIDMVDANCDQDYLNLVILSDAEMPDRTEAILSKQYDKVYDRMLSDVRKLEACGCEAFGVTCNTAHFFIDQMEKELKIPVIHMVKETVNYITKTSKDNKIAILATDGTIKTHLYQNYMEDANLIPYTPDEETQQKVMYEIYDRIKSGKSTDKKVWLEIEETIKKAGCKKAILGCTELSVINKELNLDDFYIDPMEILATRMIEYSGKKLKKEYEL